MDELASSKVNRIEGLEDSIADFFIHDFNEEILSGDLRQEVEQFLENAGGLLALEQNEQLMVVQKLQEIYLRHCSFRALVVNEDQLPDEVQMIVDLIITRVHIEIT